MAVSSGVYPCYENQFAVGKTGTDTATTPIANCDEFSVAFDNGVEEWTAFENEGWKSRLMTAKSVTIHKGVVFNACDRFGQADAPVRTGGRAVYQNGFVVGQYHVFKPCASNKCPQLDCTGEVYLLKRDRTG